MRSGGAINTTTTLSANLWTYYNKRLLSRLEENLKLYQLGDMRPLPKGYGKVVYFLRYNNMTVDDAQTLAEGSPPNDTALSSVNVSAEIVQYGNYTIVSDMITTTAIDPVVNSAIDVLSYNANTKIDTVLRTELDAVGGTQYANGKTALSDVSTSDVLTAKEFLKASTTLKSNAVPTRADGNFVAVCHPAVLYDVMNDVAVGGWTDMTKYVTAENMYKGEVGKAYGVRVIESQNMSHVAVGTSGTATVFNTLVMGNECFAVIELSGQNLKTYIKAAGSAGTADPLDQRSTVGYKMTFAVKYLGGEAAFDTDRLIKIKSGTASGVTS